MATRTHTVRSGETLSAIGARYGVDWRTIAQANHGRAVTIDGKTFTFRNAAPYTIWPGLALAIPGGAPAPAPVTPAPVIEPAPMVTVDPAPTPVDSGSNGVLYVGLAVLGFAGLFWMNRKPARRK
jgi:hypothetical protein